MWLSERFVFGRASGLEEFGHVESIQHGLFQYFAAPIILYGVLGGIMGVTGYLKGAKEDLKSDTEAKGDTP